MEYYFSDFRHWDADERKAIAYCRGRILDIGCGAGRHSLYLQQKGFEVHSFDVSPLAIKTCKLRGIRHARVLTIDRVTGARRTFDTILMLGNNFGLFGGYRKAKQLLAKFHSLTNPTTQIIAECLDPYDTTNPHHLSYHRRNKAKGRMAGQLRIRVRYKDFGTPWFDYLFVSQNEMRNILKGTGWQVRKTLRSHGPTYVALIEKTEKNNSQPSPLAYAATPRR
jgi:SAM-dependent methyltransferase